MGSKMNDPVDDGFIAYRYKGTPPVADDVEVEYINDSGVGTAPAGDVNWGKVEYYRLADFHEEPVDLEGLERAMGMTDLAPRSAKAIAERAASLVSGERQTQHGDKLQNMEKIAQLWNAWLIIRKPGPINGHDVAMMNALQKAARTQSGAMNVDDYVDLAGYAGVAGEVVQDMFDRTNAPTS